MRFIELSKARIQIFPCYSPWRKVSVLRHSHWCLLFPGVEGQKWTDAGPHLGCKNLGHRASKKCACPTRLAYTTVDAYIGKLRAIFIEVGRAGDWNNSLAHGNPASAPKVKQSLKAVTEEQLVARVTLARTSYWASTSVARPVRLSPFYFGPRSSIL